MGVAGWWAAEESGFEGVEEGGLEGCGFLSGGICGGRGEGGCLLENSERGRWDRRSKITSWCSGGAQLGRYCSRKVMAGLGMV